MRWRVSPFLLQGITQLRCARESCFNGPVGGSRECGGTGRRAGFRFQWGNPWEFESLHSHHAVGVRGGIGPGGANRYD